MAEVGGMLAAAILKVVGEQIGSAIGGQITLQKNFDANLKKMKMALESVEAVLKAAERRSITDEPTRLWLKRLTDAMYDISSIIDEFETDKHKVLRKKSLLRFVSCLQIGPRITIANQIKMMGDELKKITDNHQSFTLTADTSAVQLTVTDIRETSSIMQDKEDIIGRTDEKGKILACLSESMKKEFTILPIYGIGGLGKTTLAKIIIDDSQFSGYSQVWIYVSQSFDLQKIGNSLISQLSKEKIQYTEMQMIQNSLQELLANKKILIVLDDLWEDNRFHLNELMDMLKVGKSGSMVVIVTTRSEEIAMKISTIQPHKLASLTDKMCWTIIKQNSDFELRNDQEELEQIGKDIASKCGGVALAAQSIGHMLHSLKFDEWESIRNSGIWNLSDSEDTSLTCVLTSLRLSYSVMPSNLKLCFAYCAIFPKGYKIVKDDLIKQWISLGFIKATNMLSTWQVGEKYIRQLLGLSFLEHSRSTWTTEVNFEFENDTFFTMHDLVHDLARSVMVDEILVASKQGKTGGSCCHFALLNDCGKPLESSKIRALRFMECGDIKLHGAAFSSAKSMLVLDLSECSIHKLPNSIGVLKQLRYLNAPRVQDAIIPNSITRLSKLLYLNLNGSSRIKVLPNAIGEIEGLAYLDLSGCSAMGKLPKSFGRLKELVHLDLSNCSCVEGISEFLEILKQLQYLNLSYCRNIGELPEALGGLCKLQYLDLSFSSYLNCCPEADFWGALNKLEYLNLSSQFCGLRKLPEALGGFIQLKYLNLSGCSYLTELPRLFGSLRNLLHLDLSNCRRIEHLNEALVGLTNLQHLNLRRTRITLLPDSLTEIRYLNLSGLLCMSNDTFTTLIKHISNNLSNLEHLNLSSNCVIESIPGSLCILRKLHTLNLSECRLLEKIPESICTIESLKVLYLNGCHLISKPPQLGSNAVSLPNLVVQPGNSDSSSNLVQLEQVDPDVLRISKLENVKSAAEAHHIKLMEKKRLYDLELKWTEDVERFVDDRMLLEKLVPPSTLKELEISGYNGVSFPSWLVGQLPNLEKLVLRGMASLEEWNTSYSSGEEHVIWGLEIHDCPMLKMKPLPPKANKWVISNSDKVLSSWEECTGSQINATSSFSPVTTELSVKNCKVSLHQWRLLQYLPGLISLHIKGSVDLTGSPEVIEHLSSLETLELGVEDLEELPKWLNENKRQLTNLRSLQLVCCNSMAALPHWLGELTSLKKLGMWDCAVLSSFPESIQQLTSLQTLNITNCPELKHLVCLLPSSLSSLQISSCNSIKSLPEGMEQLTNLQRLDINECPDLEQWCELEENKMKLAHIGKQEIRDEVNRGYFVQTGINS